MRQLKNIASMEFILVRWLRAIPLKSTLTMGPVSLCSPCILWFFGPFCNTFASLFLEWPIYNPQILHQNLERRGVFEILAPMVKPCYVWKIVVWYHIAWLRCSGYQVWKTSSSRISEQTKLLLWSTSLWYLMRIWWTLTYVSEFSLAVLSHQQLSKFNSSKIKSNDVQRGVKSIYTVKSCIKVHLRFDVWIKLMLQLVLKAYIRSYLAVKWLHKRQWDQSISDLEIKTYKL